MAKRLSEAQWEDILKRHIVDGIGSRSLAEQYGVPESSIRTRAKTAQSAQIKYVANQIVTVSQNLKALNPHAQTLTLDLSSKLCNISNNLASAGELGSKNAERLMALAGNHMMGIDPDNIDFSIVAGVKALGDTAGKHAEIGMGLLNANKLHLEKMAQQSDNSLDDLLESI